MKILKKNEAASEVTKQRKEQIEEGAIIAGKVDKLRLTLADLEAQEARFISGMKDRLEKETGSLQELIKSKKSDLALLEEKRTKLLAPVDLTNEWATVKKLKQDLFDRETSIILREARVQEILKKEAEISAKDEKATVFLEEARKIYDSTDVTRRQMEDRKQKSEAIIEKALLDISETEKNLIRREHIVKADQEQVAKDKKNILDRGSQLIAREALVDSGMESLGKRENEIKDREVLSKRLNFEATKNFERSEETKESIDKLKEEAESEIEIKHKDLAKREQKLGYAERDLAIQKEDMQEERTRIENEKLHIASQQETLRDAWARIKNLENN